MNTEIFGDVVLAEAGGAVYKYAALKLVWYGHTTDVWHQKLLYLSAA